MRHFEVWPEFEGDANYTEAGSAYSAINAGSAVERFAEEEFERMAHDANESTSEFRCKVFARPAEDPGPVTAWILSASVSYYAAAAPAADQPEPDA